MSNSAVTENGQGDDELIDVVRIRLSNPTRATALLSEFQSADHVLATWAAIPGCSPVDFEITFDDGHVMRGRFECVERRLARRAFSTHVRRLLRPKAPGQKDGLALAAHYLRYCAPA